MFIDALFVDMPRGFSRRFLRHGLLLCTSAVGTGFLGQYFLEVNFSFCSSHKRQDKNVNI